MCIERDLNTTTQLQKHVLLMYSLQILLQQIFNKFGHKFDANWSQRLFVSLYFFMERLSNFIAMFIDELTNGINIFYIGIIERVVRI